MDLLKGITKEYLNGLEWLNEPCDWGITEKGIYIVPPDNSDFFNDPRRLLNNDTAPYLYKRVKGDFTARVHVKPCFNKIFNAASIMVYINKNVWAKLCFEWCDAECSSVVNVVTREISDDATGPSINAQDVWLQIVRKDNIYAMHWSLDGNKWLLARNFVLDDTDEVLVGIEGQCPVGNSAKNEYLYLSIDPTVPQDIRKGI
ncbi:MAG: hypothetical protein A2Y21_05700 [Clostridiales bacterium GWC2_40_7]|nr:MAG: hypothetical protein A2Y21_05700 [Clostridiales bacterium GWC2_40_7]